MFKLEVTEIGDSLGIIVPKEVLDQFNVRVGDFLFLTESRDGVQIKPCDPEFEEDMELARTRKFMREHRDALRELAKS